MTRAQVQAYIAKMKKAQGIAKRKLKAMENSPEKDIDALELEVLEEKLDNL
jgi:hypothetical protein